MRIKSLIARVLGPWIFGVASWLYDWMTTSTVWQESCANLLWPLPQDAGDKLILDLGVGPGVSALSMGFHRPNVRFVGLDLSRQMLKRARAGRDQAGWAFDRLMLIQADGGRLPLATERFDAITAHSFLYLVSDPVTVLAEAKRVLQSGGLAAFMEPNMDFPDWGWLIRQRSGQLLFTFTLWRFYSWVHGRYSRESLTVAFQQAGFVEVTTAGSLKGFGLYAWAKKP